MHSCSAASFLSNATRMRCAALGSSLVISLTKMFVTPGRFSAGCFRILHGAFHFCNAVSPLKLCVNGSRKISGDAWPTRGALVIVMRPSGCGAKSTLSPGCGPNNSRIPLCSVICVLLVNVEIIWAHREMGGDLSDLKESDQVATGYCLPVDIVDDRLVNNAIAAAASTNAIIGPPPNPKSK